MIYCNEGRCDLMGTSMDLSAELSVIIEHYFIVLEEKLGEKITKAMFESALKTAMELKNRREEENGKDDA